MSDEPATSSPVVLGAQTPSAVRPGTLLARVARGLSGDGREVRVLFTGRVTGAEIAALDMPPEVGRDVLPCNELDAWSVRWEALIRYLEERAPCVYVMSHDCRTDVVAPRLSNRIRLIGVVQQDSGPQFQQAVQLGHLWDAIVAVSDAIHFRLARRAPHLARRLLTIPLPAPGGDSAALGAEFVRLVGVVERRAASREFVRERHPMSPPAQTADGVEVLAGDHRRDAVLVNEQALWPDAYRARRDPRLRLRRRVRADAWMTRPLADHRVLVAMPSGRISHVDVFSAHLVRHLRGVGVDAVVLGERALGVEPAGDLPVEGPHMPPATPWRRRWRVLSDYLGAQGPCVYLPNDDYDHSAVAATLPASVKVVAIAHSDDPAHYQHVMRLGDASNAIVGVSDVIVEHLAGLAPPWAARVHAIPYGVDVPSGGRPRRSDVTLRVVYAGRLTEQQKRVGDLVAIARTLAAMVVPFELTIIGDGPSRQRLERESRALILDRRVRFLGTLANDDVLRVLRESDACLVVSAYEGLSVAMLEAMANHVVPVVSASRSGTPQVIRHGHNGLVAPTGDIAAFAEHLARLANDVPFREQLAGEAHRTIRDGGLRVEDMVARYLDLLHAVVERPFARPRREFVVPPHLRAELGLRRQLSSTMRRRVPSVARRVRNQLR